MSNCMMEVGAATRWCNPYAQGLNALSLRICLAVDLSHIRACVGSSIVTTTAALREARITSATKMIDYKINLLENTVWDHMDECVLIRELSLKGSSWRGQVKCELFKGCGSCGPWTCRICRGRRWRLAAPGPALSHRWSLRHQRSSSCEGRLSGWLLWQLQLRWKFRNRLLMFLYITRQT